MYAEGTFQEYQATGPLYLGAIKITLRPGSTFAFDGTTLRLSNGVQHQIPTLRSAIEAGWVVLASKVANHTPAQEPQPLETDDLFDAFETEAAPVIQTSKFAVHQGDEVAQVVKRFSNAAGAKATSAAAVASNPERTISAKATVSAIDSGVPQTRATAHSSSVGGTPATVKPFNKNNIISDTGEASGQVVVGRLGQQNMPPQPQALLTQRPAVPPRKTLPWPEITQPLWFRVGLAMRYLEGQVFRDSRAVTFLEGKGEYDIAEFVAQYLGLAISKVEPEVIEL